MSKKKFFQAFENNNIDEALDAFNHLNKNQQHKILRQLHYQAREASAPVAVAVLNRKLHEGKTFDDFYDAWMPPISETSPFIIGNKTYHQYFNCPTRVINAVNREDPSDIISVGLMWCSKEEFEQQFSAVAASKSNANRGSTINNTAEKVSANIYMVKADTELGN